MGILSAAAVDGPAPPAPVPEPRRPSEALAALKDSGAVGLAVFPIGIAFGVYLTHTGLAWWWASVFATVIYAGSLEFLLVALVGALAPPATIALTALLVNVRHVFYALSFPLHRVQGRLGKTYSTFALTDEAYALSTAETARSWTSKRILWLQGFIHLYWVSGATSGALLGAVIPDRVVGLEFAMTALFTVLAMDALRAGRDLPTSVIALLSALIARVLFPGQLLLAAFALFTVGLLVHRTATEKGPDHA